MGASVQARNLGIRFLFDAKRRLLSPTLAPLHRHVRSAWGLRGVDLTIEPGEAVAFVGTTGSGKTTLLRVLARVLVPDEGTVEVHGRVGSLLAVQAGLLGSLTGRENALLLGVLYGLSRDQARAALPKIREESGLADAYDLPVSSYSQGMMARLGFAVADAADPELLLLDEVHEALDHDFRVVVAERSQEIRDRGGIVIVAGHDHDALARLCDRGIRLEDGAVVADGPVDQIVAAYVG
jgi:ABC-type polysaccharide/polyol phosphate transport system ATPase subunit